MKSRILLYVTFAAFALGVGYVAYEYYLREMIYERRQVQLVEDFHKNYENNKEAFTDFIAFASKFDSIPQISILEHDSIDLVVSHRKGHLPKKVSGRPSEPYMAQLLDNRNIDSQSIQKLIKKAERINCSSFSKYIDYGIFLAYDGDPMLIYGYHDSIFPMIEGLKLDKDIFFYNLDDTSNKNVGDLFW